MMRLRTRKKRKAYPLPGLAFEPKRVLQDRLASDELFHRNQAISILVVDVLGLVAQSAQRHPKVHRYE